jgi:hypothetical protein
MIMCDWCHSAPATHDVEAFEELSSCCDKCKNKARTSLVEMYGPGVGSIRKRK